jgi:photosystem II stability/assembly factor-like uncharacterized protein
MMTQILHRYPGAQPFRDDEFSRRTFFGREPASIALTDQILANRLVVVYAKSGLGKTSLLNAGAAPRLREAANMPLFVRVNNIEEGPLFSVFEGVRAEAERQQVEYVDGDRSSLWSFFKTVEFWRNDLLLTPVLILDQFEELFTLQSQEKREKFLLELGYLIRGVSPQSHQPAEANLSDAPPSLHVVLSLREDFLGLLEEASDHIPEIMDHRYRLAPLSYEMASKAITEPAAIDDKEIATKAFRLKPDFVTSILNYLTRSTTGRGTPGRQVEPFHLQLICQRIEKIAAFKQQSESGEIVLSFQDIGGEAGLAKTLENFYTNAIHSIPGRHLQGAVRILCEQFLISPEGRRLSIDERELLRQLKLPRETLSQLVESRLLRTDRRSDSTYYELSHDALVQPVLASRRMQALVVGWSALVAGAIIILSSGGLIALFVWYSFSKARETSDYAAASFFIIFSLFLGTLGRAWFRSGLRRRKRYRQHTPSEFAKSLPTLLPLKQKILGWFMMVAGPILLAVWGLYGLFGLIKYATAYFTRGNVSPKLVSILGDIQEAFQLMHDHPAKEAMWWFVEHSTIVALGWLLVRQGARTLWPHKFRGRSKALAVPGVDQSPSLVLASVKALCGVFGLVGSCLGFLTLRACSSLQESIPYWLSWAIVSYRLHDACQDIYQKGWGWDAISFALFFFAAFVFSLALVRDGVGEVSTSLRPQAVRPRWAMLIALACAILVATAVFFSARASLRSRNQTGRDEQRQAQAATANPNGNSPPSGWAVGSDAKILHTEDGNTWKAQNSGTGEFYSVTFPARQSGWAVGAGGAIWHSENGGAKWDVQTSGTLKSLSVVAATGPASSWIVGDHGTILHTEDAGKTWEQQSSGTHENLFAVAFATPRLGWVVGHAGVILHTEDGGRNWKSQISGSSSSLDFVAFATSQSGWAVGSGGTILHTEDGGTVWHPQISRTIRNLSGIALVTSSSGWSVGEKGVILHTKDAGITWTSQASGTRVDLSEAAFVTPLSGWVVGHSGIILHTEDGGDTWVQQASGTRADLQSVSFVRPYGMIGVVVNGGKDRAQASVCPAHSAAIISVVLDGPADKAGLKKGDCIVALNGEQVNDGDELVGRTAALPPGTQAKLAYVHKGRPETATVTIGDGSKLSAKGVAR